MDEVIQSNRTQEIRIRNATNDALGNHDSVRRKKEIMNLYGVSIEKEDSDFGYRNSDSISKTLARFVQEKVLGAYSISGDRYGRYYHYETSIWLPRIICEMGIRIEDLKLRVEFDDWKFRPTVDLAVSFSESKSLEHIEALIVASVAETTKNLLWKCWSENSPRKAKFPSLHVEFESSYCSSSLEVLLYFESHVRPVSSKIDLKYLCVRQGDQGIVERIVSSLEVESILADELRFFGLEDWLLQVTAPVPPRLSI